jgi:hypothetical protein
MSKQPRRKYTRVVEHHHIILSQHVWKIAKRAVLERRRVATDMEHP